MKKRLAPMVLGSALAASLFTFFAYDRVQSGLAGDRNRVVADNIGLAALSLPTGAALLVWDGRAQ
ncbi:MAG TPA: hypothetical protein VME66_00460 [Candidatus Acidoferrales bacterium]|nr:hypothetical protein [Candidatus Acidoferrales bacterium]